MVSARLAAEDSVSGSFVTQELAAALQHPGVQFAGALEKAEATAGITVSRYFSEVGEVNKIIGDIMHGVERPRAVLTETL